MTKTIETFDLKNNPLKEGFENLKLSGTYKLDNTIEIDGGNFSLEGLGEEGLTIKTDLKQLLSVKNKGVLKCTNVTFEGCKKLKANFIKKDEICDEEEIKEPGFIDIQNGSLELIKCKVLDTFNGICMGKNSTGTIFNSIISNNVRGITVNSSKLMIEKSTFESNGIKNKAQPQIKIDRGSEVSIKECKIKNSVADSGIYISQSNLRLEKSSIKKNDIGISICDNGELKITDSEINNNRKEGIYSHYNSKILINRCQILNNKSNGIVVRDNSASIILNSFIKENIRGLDIKNSKTKVSKCEFDSNVRGIYVSAGSIVELEKSIIKNSKLNGLCIECATVEMCDCIIKNNSIENEEYYQVYIGKKSIVNGLNTEILDAPVRHNDVYSEYINSRVHLSPQK